MDPFLHEWGSALLRWLHVVAGMAWIGASFYFMHIDAHLKPAPDIPKGGEAWEVHGGGFYQVRKWLVAPGHLPPDLLWHKWEAYATWTSGFALLCWIHYAQADLYLIDPAVRDLGPWAAAGIGVGALALGWAVYDALVRALSGRREALLVGLGFALILLLAWGFQQVFSGRGALLHTGAVMATWMAGNVAMVIIPNQRKVIADLVAGREPDPALGQAGKTRSTHNNYLTLPVVFLMLANHTPLAWSTDWAFAVVGLVTVAGALVRVFYNRRHAGRGDAWWTWGAAAACMALAVAVSMTASPQGRERIGLAAQAAPDTAAAGPGAAPGRGHAAAPPEVVEIVLGRCSMCHAAEPVWTGIAVAPKGVRLDTPEAIAREAPAIRVQAVLTRAMPPNNVTGMAPEERAALAAWLGAAGAAAAAAR